MSSLNDVLTDFFNWRPARLYFPTGSDSKVSRDTCFYDKLLSERFILRRVRHLPSLPKDIAGTVDDALKSISDRGIKLPPPSEGFPTKSLRSYVEKARSTAMKNELSVAEFYGYTTALFCAPVASTLALQPELPSLPKWLNLLYWTVSLSKNGYGIADGSLQIFPNEMGSPDNARSEAEKALDESGFGPLLQQIREILGDLAVFKSLSVGAHPIMLGIRNEAFTGIPFRWETIDNGEHERVRHQYESPIGPDAEKTPWTLPLPPSDSSDNSDSSAERGDGQSALQPLPDEANTVIQAAQSLVPIEPPIRSLSLSSLSSVSSDDDSEAAEQGHGQIVQEEASTATEKAVMRGRSRGGARGRSRRNARGRSRSEGPGRGLGSQYPGSLSNKKRKRDDDDDDENYKSKQEFTAASFIQQAWAQAVRHDATLIIIQSGNTEYVCVRHRATQTLYVSDLIDVPNCENPGYAKLHTGIYLTALRDAMQRVAQMPRIEIGDASENNRNGAEDDGHRRDRKKGSGKGKEREPGSGSGARDSDFKQIISECDKRKRLVMHFQYGIYDSPVPAAFVRVVASMPTPQCRRVFQADGHLMLVITSEIGTGATGIVHGGTLDVELPGQCVSLGVVAKLAFSDHQKERLAHENAIYRYLSSRHITGIPMLLGLFSSVDGGPSALLMTSNGVSISSNKKPLSSATQEEFLKILQKIHEVGILHHDIRCQNLLIDNCGHASIIDFDQAQRCSSAKAMEEEFLYLVGLLNS